MGGATVLVNMPRHALYARRRRCHTACGPGRGGADGFSLMEVQISFGGLLWAWCATYRHSQREARACRHSIQPGWAAILWGLLPMLRKAPMRPCQPHI